MWAWQWERNVGRSWMGTWKLTRRNWHGRRIWKKIRKKEKCMWLLTVAELSYCSNAGDYRMGLLGLSFLLFQHKISNPEAHSSGGLLTPSPRNSVWEVLPWAEQPRAPSSPHRDSHLITAPVPGLSQKILHMSPPHPTQLSHWQKYWEISRKKVSETY